MDPVVVTFNSNTGDLRILEGLQDGNGAGKSFRQNLADMKQIATNQQSIDLLPDGGLTNTRQTGKEVVVAFALSGRISIAFAQVNVGGVDEFHDNRALPKEVRFER